MANLSSGFFGPFVAEARGSAAGVTVTKRNNRWEAQKRRRGVVPAGDPARYWRKVYVVVERLWNDLPPADKATWLYGKKPIGLTARDYFGRWNMNLAGRWSRWVRQRPQGMQYKSRKTDWAGAEPLPIAMDACLYGAWHHFAGSPPIGSAQYRGASATAGSLAAAWAAAWAALAAKPWVEISAWVGHNYGFVGGSGGSYTGWAFQGRCVLAIGPIAGYAWRKQALTFINGYGLTGAQDIQFKFGESFYGPGRRSCVWPQIRDGGPATRYRPALTDVGNWAPPPAPSSRYQYRGWYVGGMYLQYDWRS